MSQITAWRLGHTRGRRDESRPHQNYRDGEYKALTVPDPSSQAADQAFVASSHSHSHAEGQRLEAGSLQDTHISCSFYLFSHNMKMMQHSFSYDIIDNLEDKINSMF